MATPSRKLQPNVYIYTSCIYIYIYIYTYMLVLFSFVSMLFFVCVFWCVLSVFSQCGLSVLCLCFVQVFYRFVLLVFCENDVPHLCEHRTLSYFVFLVHILISGHTYPKSKIVVITMESRPIKHEGSEVGAPEIILTIIVISNS